MKSMKENKNLRFRICPIAMLSNVEDEVVIDELEIPHEILDALKDGNSESSEDF